MKHEPRALVIDWQETILRTSLPPYAKFLALYLRTFMNSKNDMAWPSLKRIEGETGLGHATVLKYLGVLEAEGWIYRQRGGIGVNTVYHAMIPKSVEGRSRADLGKEPSRSGGDLGGSGGDLGVGREPTTNKQLNKQRINNTQKMERFEELWPLYPRKEGKADAKKAWKALTEEEMTLCIDNVKTRAFPSEKKYIPLPASFIRGKRWEDELEVSKDDWRTRVARL